MTTVTRYDDTQHIYTVPVGRSNEMKSVDEYKYEEKCQHSLICPGESISNKEQSRISEKTTMRLYIVLGAPTLFCQQVNQNSCILSFLVSSLHYIGDEYLS